MAANYERKCHTLPSKRAQCSESPFRSANPLHLHEVTSNAQLDYVDDASAQLFKTCGLDHPTQARTMKEYDRQISDLKKENFNLKLRIYFLEERMQRTFRSADGEDVHKKNIELQVELESCKKEMLDKQKLLLKASETLDSLERQHCVEMEKQKRELESEVRRLRDGISQLEKESQFPVTAQKRSSVELYRQAFPGLEFPRATSPVREYSMAVGEEKERHAELEAVMEDQTTQIQMLSENVLKSQKTIRGLLKVCSEKDEKIESLEGNLEAKLSELNRISSLNYDPHSSDRGDVTRTAQSFSLLRKLSDLRTELRARNDALAKVKNIIPQLCQDGSLFKFDLKFLDDTAPQIDYPDLAPKECEDRPQSQKSFDDRDKCECRAKKEMVGLNFKLAATEATVRALATKARRFREMLSKAGIVSGVPRDELHRSESNLHQPDPKPSKGRLFHSALDILSPAVLNPSSICPETPVKLPKTESWTQTLAGREEVEGLRDQLEKVERGEDKFSVKVRILLEEKSDLMRELEENRQRLERYESERAEVERLVLENAELNGKTEELEKMIQDLRRRPLDVTLNGGYEEMSTVRKFVARSQDGVDHLRRRLEELCAFLESLLKFDANGILDTSDLTPQKILSIKHHLNLSRELTGNLSESMHVLGNISAEMEVTDSFANDSSCRKRFSETEDREDNFVLLMKPQRGRDDTMAEELPTFSISFTPTDSMRAAKTNSGDRHQRVSVKDVASLSESDSWSEPDRNVSLQRMGGLEEHVRSPKSKQTCRGRTATLSESEASSELARWHQKRFPKLHTGPRRARSEDGETRRLQARVQALEELNRSLRAELKIYYSLQTVVGSASSGTETEVAVPSKAVDVAGLVEPLREIAALRRTLEQSIRAYEWLREEFEKRLECVAPSVSFTEKGSDIVDVDRESSGGESVETDEVGNLRMLLNEKENFIRDLREANERLRRTVDSVSGLLSERESVIRARCEEVKHLEEDLERMSREAADRERVLGERAAELRELSEKVSRAREERDLLSSAHVREKARLEEELESAKLRLRSALVDEERVGKLEGENGKLREEKETLNVRILKAEEEAAELGKGEIDVVQLLREIKSLRLQLERSIETNTALGTRLESHEGGGGGGSGSRRRYLTVSEDGLGEGPRGPVSADNSVYSSPDLGIESDRSQFSSLDCRLGGPITRGWTWPTDKLEDGGEGSYVRNTFTEGLQLPTSECSSDKGLRKRATVKVELIAAMQVVKKIRELLAGSNTVGGDELPNAEIYCSVVYRQLKECARSVEAYELPGDCDAEKEEMVARIAELQRQLAAQQIICADVTRKLRTAVRFKEGMEKAVIKQLSKTHGVLRKARGNLEQSEKRPHVVLRD